MFLAAQYEQIEAVKILLINKANPFLKSVSQKSVLKVRNSEIISKMVQKAMLVRVNCYTIPFHKRENLWNEEVVKVLKLYWS